VTKILVPQWFEKYGVTQHTPGIQTLLWSKMKQYNNVLLMRVRIMDIVKYWQSVNLYRL